MMEHSNCGCGDIAVGGLVTERLGAHSCAGTPGHTGAWSHSPDRPTTRGHDGLPNRRPTAVLADSGMRQV